MAAWLLEENHEVTLFEAQDYLGGHAQTAMIELDGMAIPIEIGFEFFSTPLFPYFNCLLKLLNVPVTRYPLSYTFHTAKDALALPPLHGKLSYKRLTPSSLFTMLQFNYLLYRGRTFVHKEDSLLTLTEFADSIFLSSHFKNNFLYPFYAGAWGAAIDDMKNFSAYDILKWSIANKPAGFTSGTWLEVKGGISTYINALVKELTHTRLHVSTRVVSLSYAKNGYILTTNDGQTLYPDHIIFATNAVDAQKLLKALPHAQRQHDALAQVSYFHTTIAVHGDERLMPKDKSQWSIANIYYDGKKSSLTVYKPWHSPKIFRSWIMQGQPLPEQLYLTKEYVHAKVNREYFIAQKELTVLQGSHNLWFAGIYVHDIDSHDSALASAVALAQKLAPQSQRLLRYIQKLA